MKFWRILLFYLLVALPSGSCAFADHINTDANGVAVKGYDVVAYFINRQPVFGNSEYAYEWMGAQWYFANAEHRDLFKQAPGQYVPQYGGFCAFGVARGYKTDIDPGAWSIVDGKLYLNFSVSVRTLWQQNPSLHIRRADQNWLHLR